MSRWKPSSGPFLALAGLTLVFTFGCDAHIEARGAEAGGAGAGGAGCTETPAAIVALSDAPLAVWQIQLLDLAFDSATAIPVKPLIKDRSLAQEQVIEACLELDQPAKALGFIPRIDNWRRGAAYADLAFYCAQHSTGDVPQYLKLAGQVVEETDDWRKDRIKVKIARAYAWLGEAAQAAQFEAGLVESESGKADAVRAMRISDDAFDEQVAALDARVASGNFDLVNNALAAYAQLFNRFYGDTSRRSLMQEKVIASSSTLPVKIRIELIMDLAGFALAHHDPRTALELVNAAQLVLDQVQWTPEDRIALAARLASLRFLAGDTARARSDADAAGAFFDTARARMLDIDRAGALRAIAEAYQTMADTAAALAVYTRAVEEGVVNPNSRPRAEDLAATCRSMAVHKVEPDDSLWARIRQVREGFGPPW